jgi:hypothetical protein|tara:strand:+ start:406 stop:1047 length:642 start_codon:yes stop_codon:yes gene_type:complete
MKVKIRKEGKVKEFKLISKWEDVTVEKWMKLLEFHMDSKSFEAIETISEMSDIPKDLIKQLELSDVAIIMSKLGKLQTKDDTQLKRLLTIDGKEYGFHPDLDSITLGEYADLEQFIKLGINKHLPEVMAILYRPIVEKQGEVYSIEAYDGEIKIRAEQMKKMSAIQVQSALVFFYHLGREFVEILQSSSITRLKEMMMQLLPNPSPINGLGSE